MITFPSRLTYYGKGDEERRTDVGEGEICVQLGMDLLACPRCPQPYSCYESTVHEELNLAGISSDSS